MVPMARARPGSRWRYLASRGALPLPALFCLLVGAMPAWSQQAGGEGGATGTASGGIAGTAIGGAGDQPQGGAVYLGPGAGAGFTPPGSVGTAVGGLAPGATGLPQYQGVTDVFGTPYVGGGPGGALPPGYTYVPSVTVGVMGNSNAYQTNSGKSQGDIWLMMTPGIAATANTPRVIGTLNYTPSFRLSLYEPGTNSNVYQNFNINGRVSILPERFFITVLGLGYATNTAGGISPSLSNPVVSASSYQSTVQNIFLQITPTYVHHFGTAAIAQIGYMFGYTSQNGNLGFFPGSNNPYFQASETTSNTGFAILRSGEDFGRLGLQGYVIGTESGGNGALSGSHLYRTVGEVRYSVYRDLAVYTEGGYDNQHYQGSTPFEIVAPIWGVGFRAQPDPDNFILFRYGQRNGYRSPYLQATGLLGTRTRLNASYTDTLNATPLAQTGLLSTMGVDANGNLYDTMAGAPVLPIPVLNSLYSTQSALMRRRLGWFSANQTWDRDTFIASYNYFDMIPLTGVVNTINYYQKGYSFSIGWNRAFTPTLNGNAFLSVGWSESTPQGAALQTQAPSAGMNYSARIGLYNYFSETLIGSLSYIYAYNQIPTYNGNNSANFFMATLRKNF